jgi:hypothetical protein
LLPSPRPIAPRARRPSPSPRSPYPPARTPQLLLAKRLRPLANAATALSQRLDDTILQAQSECWWAATAFYSTLARISGANAKLAAALKPIIDFFAVGRRKAKAPALP